MKMKWLLLIVLLAALFANCITQLYAQPLNDIADRIISESPAADFNGDGVTDGRDVQAATDEMRDPFIGTYRASELARAKLNARAPALLADRESWVQRNAASYAVNSALSIGELFRCMSYCAEYEFLAPADGSGRATARAAGMECCRRAATLWPGDIDRHHQVYALAGLCETASLQPDYLPILKPIFDQALADLHSGTLYGTNVAMTLPARTGMLRLLGVRFSPLRDFGQDWGLKRILEIGVDDNGLFTFDGNDLWYWFFNSRGAILSVGLPVANQLPPALAARLQQVDDMPIRTLCVGGAHPWLGAAKASPKPYRFFGGFLRDWPGEDEASRWARMTIRERGDSLRFDDLIVPDDAGLWKPFADENRPPRGRGSRSFAGRFSIVEEAAGESLVRHVGFGRPINGGHRRLADYPALQIIDREKVRFPLTQEVRMLP